MEIKKYKDIDELYENVPRDSSLTMIENLIKCWAKINSPLYDKIVCAISGGADSDVMLDIVYRCDVDNKVTYAYFNTGLEYQATKDHLDYLERKYGIQIQRHKAIKPIPISCREYGQPFISKNVSEMIDRLQRHNFQWEDEPLDVLLERYCKWDEKKQDWKGCKNALMWWCNANKSVRFCIDYNKYLKEFMVANPPKHKISAKCCKYGKKDVLHRLVNEGDYDLNVFGVRKAEGGIRSTTYKTCFDEGGACDNYRPLFWYKDADKSYYIAHYRVKHSDCYLEYGLKRTGCPGCPFGRDFEFELEVIKKYEPKLDKAVNNIFGDSYEYTRAYKKFREDMETKERSDT